MITTLLLSWWRSVMQIFKDVHISESILSRRYCIYNSTTTTSDRTRHPTCCLCYMQSPKCEAPQWNNFPRLHTGVFVVNEGNTALKRSLEDLNWLLFLAPFCLVMGWSWFASLGDDIETSTDLRTLYKELSRQLDKSYFMRRTGFISIEMARRRSRLATRRRLRILGWNYAAATVEKRKIDKILRVKWRFCCDVAEYHH
jgi:hypothetical protein